MNDSPNVFKFIKQLQKRVCILTLSRKVFKIVSLTILILTTCLTSAIASAATFKGKINRENNLIQFEDSTLKNKYTLIFQNEIPKQQLSRLSDGDFVALSGTLKTEQQNEIIVSSVDYVGLTSLIGNWKSDDGLCYEFTGYNNFNVYAPQRNSNCCPMSLNVPKTKYTYFINPDVSVWTMVISSKEHELYGQLKIITNNHVEIQLFDSITEDILGTIVLRR